MELNLCTTYFAVRLHTFWSTVLPIQEPHIPYQNSKLTYLLQNWLGENSNTWVQSTHHTFQTTPNHFQFPFPSPMFSLCMHPLVCAVCPYIVLMHMFGLCSLIFVNISTNMSSVQETLCSLRFATNLVTVQWVWECICIYPEMWWLLKCNKISIFYVCVSVWALTVLSMFMLLCFGMSCAFCTSILCTVTRLSRLMLLL